MRARRECPIHDLSSGADDNNLAEPATPCRASGEVQRVAERAIRHQPRAGDVTQPPDGDLDDQADRGGTDQDVTDREHRDGPHSGVHAMRN